MKHVLTSIHFATLLSVACLWSILWQRDVPGCDKLYIRYQNMFTTGFSYAFGVLQYNQRSVHLRANYTGHYFNNFNEYIHIPRNSLSFYMNLNIPCTNSLKTSGWVDLGIVVWKVAWWGCRFLETGKSKVNQWHKIMPLHDNNYIQYAFILLHTLLSGKSSNPYFTVPEKKLDYQFSVLHETVHSTK